MALAELLALSGVTVIPKSIDPAKLRENWQAQHLRLTGPDRAELAADFPPPRSQTPLAVR